MPAELSPPRKNGHARSTCDAVYWTLQDANYNVAGVVDSTGTLVERYEYTPYGQRTVYFSPGTNDSGCYAPTLVSRRRVIDGVAQPWGLCEFGHQGLMHDEESGNIDNRARILIPPLGRFGERDPAGHVDGMTLYEYARSAPCQARDPRGLAAQRPTGEAGGTTVFTDTIDVGPYKGEVSFRTSVRIHPNPPDYAQVEDGLVAITYRGSRCVECFWVQFVWNKITMRKKGQDALPLSGTIPVAGFGDLTLTDKETPIWYVDSPDESDPRYEAAGYYDRDMQVTTIYDKPRSLLIAPIVKHARTKNADWIEFIGTSTFQTFLACGRPSQSLYMIEWTSTSKLEPPDKLSGPEYRVVKHGAGAPDKGQMDALNKQFPNRDILEGK